MILRALFPHSKRIVGTAAPQSERCPCGDSRPRLSDRAKIDCFSSPLRVPQVPCHPERPRFSSRRRDLSLNGCGAPAIEACLKPQPEACILLRRYIQPASFFFFHFLAHQRGMPAFRIDQRSHGQATARHRVGVLLLDDHTVFDSLGGRRRCLASYRRRRWSLSRRLLRPAADQQQTNAEQTNQGTNIGPRSHSPTLLHAFCFRSLTPACRWQS
jgi:hypothetical protein